MAQHPHSHAERGRRLPLAGARVDDQQSLFELRGRLLLLEALFMPLGHALVRVGIGMHVQLQTVPVRRLSVDATRERLRW